MWASAIILKLVYRKSCFSHAKFVASTTSHAPSFPSRRIVHGMQARVNTHSRRSSTFWRPPNPLSPFPSRVRHIIFAVRSMRAGPCGPGLQFGQRGRSFDAWSQGGDSGGRGGIRAFVRLLTLDMLPPYPSSPSRTHHLFPLTYSWHENTRSHFEERSHHTIA